MSAGTYLASDRRPGLLEELWRFRWLLANMVVRELKLRNRQSVLGFAWTMVSPLMTMGILAVLFSEIFGARLKGGSFPLYVMSGLLPWNLFSAASAGGLSSITLGGSIIRKVYVPKAVFPVATVASSYVNFVLSFIPLIVFMVAVRAPLTWNLFFAAIPTLEIAVFALGVSLMLATLHVFFRDVKWFYDTALVAGFYATPIFYTPEIVGAEYLPILKLNPLWPMLRAFRNPIIKGVAPDVADLALGGAAALISVVLGWSVLRKYDQSLINYL